MSALIGLCGRKRAGKDATARIVFPDYTRRAFADPLREAVAAEYGHDRLPSGRTLLEALAVDGWEGLKSHRDDLFAARRLLQDTGLARREDDPDYWLNLTINDGLPERCVITDVRFPNEMAAIRARGGVIIHITNALLPPDVDPHISEWAWREHIQDTDPVLDNPGTVTPLMQAGVVLRQRLGV